MRIGDINSTSNGQVPDSIFIRVKEVEDHVLQLVRYVSSKICQEKSNGTGQKFISWSMKMNFELSRIYN